MSNSCIAGDYPLAQWVPADPTNFRAGRPVTTYSQVVIHCTDGRTNAMPVASMWQEPHHGSSAHFVVGQDGTVIQSVRLADTAWHAHHASLASIGVEHCARTPRELGPSDTGLPPSQAQYEASAKLVAWLLRHAALQPTRDVIKGHAEADPKTTHDDCPDGCGWNWDLYMAMVKSEFDALEAVA